MFANRLSYLRRGQGISQSQLADKLGVKKQSVSNWENGNIMPSVDMVVKAADYFSVSVDYILGRDKPEESGISIIEATGLTAEEIAHIQFLVDDLRNRK